MDTHKGLFPLHQAAADGDVLALRSLLTQTGDDINVDMRNRRGNTALMLAAETVQVEIVRILLAAGANPLLYNMQRHTARDFCQRHSVRRASPPTPSEAEVLTLLIESEPIAKAQGMAAAGPITHTEQGLMPAQQVSIPRTRSTSTSVDDGERRCSVCGATVRRRLKIDFLEDEDAKGRLGLGECSLHVTSALYSEAMRVMRSHPKLHYHNLLDMRSLRKEISESWGALAATRSLLDELNLDPADVRISTTHTRISHTS